MSRSTYNIEYSSTDISSTTGYNTTTHASKISVAQQPLSACYCYTSDDRSRKCGSQKDSISEVTANNTIYSDETTQKRRVVRCKDTNDEEMLTYHLKLKPESLRYTFSTTEAKKISFYTDKQSDYQGIACHNRIKEPHSYKSSISQNNRNGRAKCYDEKTTNCSPVLNFNTVEFVERTIDKNKKLKRLVRDIIEAREKEKKQEAWNNYINELKNKHGSCHYEPEQYQIERNNMFNHYNTPCRCGSVWPWPVAKDDNYFDASNTSDYIIINSFPNEIVCYPISSAARLTKSNKTKEQPIRQDVKTDNTIHTVEKNPRKGKIRQLSDNQIRNASAQTCTGIYGIDADDDSYQRGKCMKDENEGYEPCVCTAGRVRDGHTNTDKFEDVKGTVTDLETRSTSSYVCFCKKDQGITTVKDNISSLETVKHFEASEVDIFLRDFMKGDKDRNITDFKMKKQDEKELRTNKTDILYNSESKRDNFFLSYSAEEKDVRIRELLDDSSERKQHELGKKATYESVTENMTKLKEHLGESKTNDNSLGIIEEKLDIIISTMNDLLSEVKLRMLDLSVEKFDTATSTMFSNKSEQRETYCISDKLLEKEIGSPKIYNNLQIERYSMDLFKSDDKTNMLDAIPASKIIADSKRNPNTENPEKLENQSVTHVIAGKSSFVHHQGEVKFNIKDPHSGVTQEETDDRSPTIEHSFVALKKESNTFMDNINRSRSSLTPDELLKLNKKNETLSQWLKSKFSPRDCEEGKKHQETSVSEDSEGTENKEGTEENSKLNQPNIKKTSNNKTIGQEFCCAYAKMKNMQGPRYRHASTLTSLRQETKTFKNSSEIMLEDVNYFNNINDITKINKKQYSLVDRAPSKIDENIMKTSGKSNSMKMRITIDRAVSKIDESLFSGNHEENFISVDRAVSRIDDIIIEEINKSHQAKKEINQLLNREFTNNYGVQISLEIPTKERATEVTDSLSITRASNSSSLQGKKYYINPSRRTPLTIAAVNTDPMSLLGLFRLSTYTVRQFLTFINFDYASYLPSVSRALPAVSEAVQYLCHICGAEFRKPSELSTHMKNHNLDSAKDCCVCRHLLQLRQRAPGMFACQFCGQCFTRAYCCELHERTCVRRRGRRLDVSDSRAILK